MNIQPVILCGGVGSRLWPVSTQERPKPFLNLAGDGSLLQQTLERVSDCDLFMPPVLVGAEQHLALMDEQCAKVIDAQIIAEPCAKGTAPAIALAAMRVPAETVLLVCPSDHHIADTQAFLASIKEAIVLAKDGFLVAFGIRPTRAETGFGYIRRGEPLSVGHRIVRFVEKPDATLAEALFKDPNYSWNGGIFAFTAQSFLRELSIHRPHMTEQVRQACEDGLSRGPVFHPSARSFGAIKAETIDYAVMENTDQAAMVPLDCGWSDLGSWSAIQDLRETLGEVQE